MVDDSSSGAGETGFTVLEVNPLDLELDPDNPRLTLDEEGRSQAELLRIMVERFKIEELAESIVSSGFQAFDPMIAWAHNGAVTILEGNRRLAALQLLLDPGRAPVRREQWRALAERLEPGVRSEIQSLEVKAYQDRADVEVSTYVGFRHVTGVLKWPALEKAKFIAQLAEEHGWDYPQIASRLGSYPRHIERHYVAYHIVRQARDEGIPGFGNIENSFGVLLRALQASGVADFLNVIFPGDPALSRSPVPPDRLDNLSDFVRWTFGTSEEARILPDSRRLTDWGLILQSPEAVSYLRRTSNPSFDRAFFRSGGQAQSLADSLFTAADRLEESVPLVSAHADDEEIKRAIEQVSRFLVQILRYFPDVGREQGLSLSDD
jgi:hypothetical protein